jgi:hypothetical protein
VCGSDLVCQTPGMPLCSATPDADVDADAGLDLGLSVKAPNPDPGDLFGRSIALSTDGVWLVVGAPMEASGASGLDGSQTDNSLAGAGAVYVFQLEGSTYVARTYIKSPAPDAGDQFGASVAISANGNVIAIGAPFEDGGGTNNTGVPTDDSKSDAGAVFIYDRSSAAAPWVPRYYLKSPSSTANQQFGSSVALTADGASLAVGGQGAEHRALLITPQPNYTGAGGPRPNVSDTDHFGSSIAVSRDGNTMLVGAELEDGPGTGFTGDPTLDTAPDAGAVYLYPFQTAQSPYGKASNTEPGDQFGIAVATDQGADVFAVGASGEDSSGTTNGTQSDNGAPDAGAVYTFERTGLASWVQRVYLKATTASAGDQFGRSVALSGDGMFLVVGAPGSSARSGAVYAFDKSGSTWAPRANLRPTRAEAGDEVGHCVAVSDDHLVIAAGAPHAAADAGTVYVFR